MAEPRGRARPSQLARRPELEITHFHGMLTASANMRALFDLVRRIARTDASILIRGETGTGKELVARAIHALGPRKGGPFRAINCATLTPDLLASELFGHVRGAFTGAIRDRPGVFALADGGTLFLDEVAEIPVDIQARLLRVLQEKTFVPVGATEPVAVDVHLVAATHRSLRAAVDAGRFRADLMYRIRVVPLFLPALRDRPGDVEALTWHFVDHFNALARADTRRVDAIDHRALAALVAYGWPGNVRELRNVIEYAFAVGTGPHLTLDELTPELRGEAPPDGTPPTATERERRRILDALDATGGRKGEAAEQLGMSRSTLWRKMKEHRLE